MHAGVHIN